MSRSKKAFVLILSGIAFFALGYFRNYIFLSINDRVSALYYNSASPPLTGILSIFRNYDYNSMQTVKWVLTCIFAVLFAALSVLTIYWLFHDKQFVFITSGLYAFIFILSLLFMLSGKIFTMFSTHGFGIARSLAHLEQSPVITFIMVLAVYFTKRIS